MTAVLDASALLALLYRESGHEVVAELLDGAVVSTVNWSETIQKVAQRGLTDSSATDMLLALGLQVLPFHRAAAEAAAHLWPLCREHGLSLGDRACLAVAQGIPDATAVTADKAWADLDIDVPVQLIR